MWNVYGSTVLFCSCAGTALNIVSIESGKITRWWWLMKNRFIKNRQMIEFDSQSILSLIQKDKYLSKYIHPTCVTIGSQ